MKVLDLGGPMCGYHLLATHARRPTEASFGVRTGGRPRRRKAVGAGGMLAYFSARGRATAYARPPVP